ncbi:MAG: glycoside hydrolase family 25 protein, partial [Oscillospiraceae bacterium]|nr:glycoside hydrolase family 25 protein [Oscillospiraceae bacterium]
TDIAESESAENTESQSTQTESTVTDSSSAESSSVAPSSSEEESSSESKQPASSKEESSSVAPSSSEKESSGESKQPASSKEESSSVAPSSSEMESSSESKQPVSSKEESSSAAPSSSEKESSSESKQPASSKEESSSVAPSSSEMESSSESKQPASSKEESSSAPQKKPGRDDCTNAAVYQKKIRDLLTEKVYNLLDISEAHTTRDTYKNGWNKDKTSYYLENSKPVKGQAIIGGMTFDFGSDGKIVRDVAKGIDVSKYQPNVDWAKVKASGVDFVIIRVGYRGYGSGVMVEDPCFKSHIAGARAAGLKVGVYFYSQAVTIEEAVEEASMALQLVEGYQLHYPIYFDTEATGTGHGRADNLSTTHRTAIANAFCQTVQNSGYKAGVYASKSWFMYQLDYSQIAKYDIWLAQYAPVADFAQRYDMWQYTGSGSVNGINGAVDLNWAYKVY